MPASLSRALTFVALSTLAACSSDPDATAAATSVASSGAASVGGASTTATVTSGAGGAGGGVAVSGPALAVPRTMPIPYVVADGSGSTGTFTVTNVGDAPVEGDGGADLAWQLSGDASISLVSAPPRLEPGESGMVTLAFAGASVQTIAEATLTVNDASATVFAVAGDASIGTSSWTDVTLPGNAPCGEGTTVSLPSAPFPHPSAGYTDDAVRLFVPDGLRDRGNQDVVVHFHGHNTDLAETLPRHRYEEHFCASGVNGVLIVPQGPEQAASGNFGKLMDPGGLEALLEQALVVLYRDGRIDSPRLGTLGLTAHSGGYLATATNLDPSTNALTVDHVHLFDAVYARESDFAGYVESGGVLRSNFTSSGGTVDDNATLVDLLTAAGITAATAPTQADLLEAQAIVYFADTTHQGATRIDGAYGEQLRFAMPHQRRGGRVELREAVLASGTVSVAWFAPDDGDRTGFSVEVRGPGGSWSVAAETTTASASFAHAGPLELRVVPRVDGVSDPIGSNVVALAPSSTTLVVDGFDRRLDGSFGGLAHDAPARAHAGAAAVTNEALTEGGFDLSPYDRILWLVGDESNDDHPLTVAEQQLISDFIGGGGAVVLSGSEVAFALDGDAFLQGTFGASYGADDSGSLSVVGVGALSGLTASYGGASALYPEDYPDVLSNSGGTTLLEYGTGTSAAVGIPGEAVLVGFPVELIDDPADRAAIVDALLTAARN